MMPGPHRTREQHGGTAFATRVDTGDYTLDSHGVAYGFGNRLEVSLARQRLGLGTLQRRLTLPVGAFGVDVFSAKLRVAGDLLYTAMPQISVGVQHKRHLDFAIPAAIGARSDRGTDVYVAASKLWLGAAGGYNLLLNATARSTRANQAGNHRQRYHGTKHGDFAMRKVNHRQDAIDHGIA